MAGQRSGSRADGGQGEWVRPGLPTPRKPRGQGDEEHVVGYLALQPRPTCQLQQQERDQDLKLATRGADMCNPSSKLGSELREVHVERGRHVEAFDIALEDNHAAQPGEEHTFETQTTS